MRTIFCLFGPTAVGKTTTALALATRIPCEIVSVDSGMVYRGMDIGTAKPTHAELAMVPHHLIDICDPSEAYSAGRFRTDALAAIEAIWARDKTPLLVGGTMLYFKALLSGLSTLPTADENVRAELTSEAKKLGGWSVMHDRLKLIDPKAAAKISPNDSQRIQRALEVYTLTGKTMSELHAETPPCPLDFRAINVALLPRSREVLHANIAKRLAAMIELGLVDEVKRLVNLPADLPSMRAVGYHEVREYLAGIIDYETMLEKILIATRQLAKRQQTWIRSWSDVQTFTSGAPDLVDAVEKYWRDEMQK